MADEPDQPDQPDEAETPADAPEEPAGTASGDATPSRRWPPATVLGLFLVVVGIAALAYAFLADGSSSSKGSTTTASTASGSTASGSSKCAGEVGSGVPGANGEIPAPPTVDPNTHFSAGRKPLCGFTEAAVTVATVNGEVKKLCLLLADSEPERERGLMQVKNRSLGGYDGMVFTFPADQEAGRGFYMRNTPMPLSIAYVGADGTVLQVVDMQPCGDVEGCPTYPANKPFRTTIEVPQGRLQALGIHVGSKVTVEPATTFCAPKG